MSKTTGSPNKPATNRVRLASRALLLLAALAVVGVLVWQGITTGGNPDPTAPNTSPTAATLGIAVLVFREGLECNFAANGNHIEPCCRLSAGGAWHRTVPSLKNAATRREARQAAMLAGIEVCGTGGHQISEVCALAQNGGASVAAK